VNNEFEFRLETPIEYAADGEVRQGALLYMKAPSNKQRFNRAKLKQSFFAALQGMSGEAKTESANAEAVALSEEEFAEYVLHLLYSSKAVNICECLDEFKQIITSHGICRVEGEADLTGVLFDRIDAEDCDKLLGAYIANFILASFYKKHLKK